MTAAPELRLGLIGDNISRSLSPLLHKLAGDQNAISVRYDRLVPSGENLTFEQLFVQCRDKGFHGINITYPYKERVMPALRFDDPIVNTIGAANTVVFGKHGPTGHNTDYSGFMAAYRAAFCDADTGPVLMIGTGGVGRAIGFALAALGTKDLRLVDRDMAKATALADALRTNAADMLVTVWDDPVKAAAGASGLINCTPIGMTGHAGTPLPISAMVDATWAFDAVYTPVHTEFLIDATAQGLVTISGWELFFQQGVGAWSIFSDRPVNEKLLRTNLLSAEEAS